jgi:hypothetical protein
MRARLRGKDPESDVGDSLASAYAGVYSGQAIMQRRLPDRLSTATHQPSPLRLVIDSWLYTLE